MARPQIVHHEDIGIERDQSVDHVDPMNPAPPVTDDAPPSVRRFRPRGSSWESPWERSSAHRPMVAAAGGRPRAAATGDPP